jgi:hypothetical protein
MFGYLSKKLFRCLELTRYTDYLLMRDGAHEKQRKACNLHVLVPAIKRMEKREGSIIITPFVHGFKCPHGGTATREHASERQRTLINMALGMTI